MVRKGFKMFLNPGMAEEYEKRHNALWPEMKEMIRQYGGHNYSIFLDRETNVLYGYLEVEDEANNSDANMRDHWNGGELTARVSVGALETHGYAPLRRRRGYQASAVGPLRRQ